MLSTANHHRLLVVDDEALNANGVSFGEEMNSAGDGSQLEQSSSADYTAKQKLDFLEQWRGDDNFKLITQTDLIKFVWDRRYKLGVSKADIDSIFQQTPAMLLSELANMKHPVDEMDPNQSSESGGLAKPKLLVRVPESSTAIAGTDSMYLMPRRVHASIITYASPQPSEKCGFTEPQQLQWLTNRVQSSQTSPPLISAVSQKCPLRLCFSQSTNSWSLEVKPTSISWQQIN